MGPTSDLWSSLIWRLYSWMGHLVRGVHFHGRLALHMALDDRYDVVSSFPLIKFKCTYISVKLYVTKPRYYRHPLIKPFIPLFVILEQIYFNLWK